MRSELTREPEALSVSLPAELVEAIAQRAAALVLEQLQQRAEEASPYMTIPEAAAYARCKRQRIDDLLSMRRLTRYKDGRRTLILRAELETHLTGSGQTGKGRPNQARQSRPNQACPAPPVGDSISAQSRATVTNPGNKPTP